MDSITLSPDGRDREVTHVDDGGSEYIEVELTMKEGVDIVNALDELTSAIDSGTFSTNLAVREFRNTTRGGINLPETASLLLETDEDARILMHALARYEPTDADLTDQVYRATVHAMKEGPMEFDTEQATSVYEQYQ